MLSNKTKGMLRDDHMATCDEQSHDDTQYGGNATHDDAGLETKTNQCGDA